MKQLKIDNEFEKLKPPITKEGRLALERLLLIDGCRDALVIWEETGIILDGTVRYKICLKHNLPFKTFEKHLANRDEAKAWIIENELGRHHLNSFQLSEMALKLKPAVKEKAAKRACLHSQGKDFFSQYGATDQKLGTLIGVGKTFIKNSEYILKYGTLEQISRARQGGIGNTTAGICKEIRKGEKENGSKN